MRTFNGLFFRDTTPDGGGGNPAPLPVYKTLKELDEAPDVPAQAPPAQAKPVDLSAVPDEPKANDKEPAKAEPPVEEPEADETEDDQEGDQGTGEPDEDEATAFYKAVDQLTGRPVKVEYPAGINPITPEGTAIRDKAIRDDAVMEFDQHLKTTIPRAYAFMLHLEAGLPEQEFFKQSHVTLPDEATFKSSTDMKVALLEKDFIERGVDEEVAKSTVAKWVKDNTLDAKAEVVYQRRRADEAKHIADLEAAETAQRQKIANGVTAAVTNMDKAINSSVRFIIPEAEQPLFKQYLRENLRFDDANGKFYIATELGDDPTGLLEGEYFKFKKGNLNALVERKANTKAVQKLRLAVNKSNNTALPNGEAKKRTGSYIPLGDL